MYDMYDSPELLNALEGRRRTKKHTIISSWDIMFPILYALSERGYTVTQIAEELTYRGYLTPSGSPILANSISFQVNKFRRLGVLPVE